MLQRIKNKYWNMLNAIERRRNPRETVLTPHDWQIAIKQILPTNEPITLIDGGAHDGQFAQEFCQHFDNIHVHAFEPNNELSSQLHKNLNPLPHTINVSALGEKCGSTTFNIGTSPMTSSVLASNNNGQSYYSDVHRPVETRTLPMTTLDQYAQDNQIDQVHILKLDLQGYELNALKGAARLLKEKRISAIFTEINFMAFYENSALFADLDLYLRQYDYQLLNLYNLATRNSTNQLTGGDALFIPGCKQQQFSIAA